MIKQAYQLDERKVSLDICKKIKELDLPVMERIMGYVTCYREPSNGTIRRSGMLGANKDNLLYAPSLHTLQKYLSDEHNIHVSVRFNCDSIDSWRVEIAYQNGNVWEFMKISKVINNQKLYSLLNNRNYDKIVERDKYQSKIGTREDALEHGLYLALTILRIELKTNDQTNSNRIRQ